MADRRRDTPSGGFLQGRDCCAPMPPLGDQGEVARSAGRDQKLYVLGCNAFCCNVGEGLAPTLRRKPARRNIPRAGFA